MLTEKDIKEAVNYGIENKDLSYSELLKDWRKDLGYGVGSATLITPYASLAILGRESALSFREPTGHEIAHKLKELEGKLSFDCTLYGEEIDSYLKCKAELWYKLYRRDPIEAKVPASPDYTRNYPAPPKFLVSCIFNFSMEGVGANDTVTLIIKDPNGKELRFTFDLSEFK